MFYSSLDTYSRGFFSSLSFLSLGSSTFVLIAAYFTYARFASGLDLSVAGYLKRRLYRILPLYWAILSAYILFAIVAGMQSKVPSDPYQAARVVLANFTLISPLAGVPQIIISTWTLTFIVLAYVVVPLFIGFERAFAAWNWTRIALPVGVAAVSIYAAYFTRYGVFGTIISAGVLLYNVRQTPGFRRFLAAITDLGPTAALLCSAVLLRVMAVYSATSSWARIGRIPAQILFVAAIALFVAARLNKGGAVNRFLELRFPQWVGKLSYSQYVGHGAALYACKVAVQDSIGSGSIPPLFLPLLLAGCYGVSLCTAAIIYSSLEMPLMRFADRLTAGTRATPVSPLVRAKQQS